MLRVNFFKLEDMMPFLKYEAHLIHCNYYSRSKQTIAVNLYSSMTEPVMSFDISTFLQLT